MFVIIIFNEILESKVFFLKRFSCSVRDFSHDLSNEEVQVLKIDLFHTANRLSSILPEITRNPFFFSAFSGERTEISAGNK